MELNEYLDRMELNEYLDRTEQYKLDHYTDIIMKTNNRRKAFKRMPLAQIHDQVMTKESKLLKELVTDNDIEKYFAVYHYLLWNGYFSHKNKFIYKENKKEECYDLALNIAAGNGCCRNIAVHFTNLVSKIQKDNNFILVGTRYKKAPKMLSKTSDITIRKAKEQVTPKKENIYYSTHAECFDNKNNIVYDPLNFNIVRMNYDDISEKYFNGTYDLGIENIFGLKETSDERIQTLYQRLAKSRLLSFVKKEPKSKEELLELRDKGIKICKENIDLLEEYHNELEEGYEYFYQKIKSK